MKRALFILAILAILAGLACGQPQYQIKSVNVGDESLYFKLCYPSNKNCQTIIDAVPWPGAHGKQPTPGMWCHPVTAGSDELTCGKGYYHLKVLTPPN